MSYRRVVTCFAATTLLFLGCDTTTRYRVLNTIFDGVPTPPIPVALDADSGTPEGIKEMALRARRAGYGEHGPYAARMCGACHLSTAANSYVEPLDQLCFRCHDLKLDKKYVHGPLASGGCTVCHDPHSSRYQYLLVSESDTFCFHCHEEKAVWQTEAHADIDGQPCTTCHDPHQSDDPALLR